MSNKTPRSRWRVKFKGMHRVKKKLADGTERIYCYPRRERGAPLITDKDGQPLDIGDRQFVSAFEAAKAQLHRKPTNNLAALIHAYRVSTDFKKLAEKTRRSYSTYLKVIEKKFGRMSIEAIQDISARGTFKEWRDTMSDTPRKADYAWLVLARVLSFGKDRGKITVNVCERGGRLYRPNRAEKIWTEDDIQEFAAVASPQLRTALMLAIWTGQREGDLLKLTWTNYDGETIRLRQSKTGTRVVIPLGTPIKELLGRLKARHVTAGERAVEPDSSAVPATILTNSRGLSWTEDGFRASWNKAFKKTTLGDLHFHDLRGTAVTRLALAGCTETEIASITGHSLKDVGELLDTHYLGGRIELARSAIRKLNAAYGCAVHECAAEKVERALSALLICETCGQEIRSS